MLSADEVAALREQVHTIAFDPYSLPPSERKCPIDDADRSELIAGYSCPAGSIVFFSECGANLTWAAVASFFLRLLSVVLPLLFLPPVPMLLPRWLLSVCLVC